MRRQEARRLVAVVCAEALAGLVHMSVDGVLGDAQLPGDLLGAQVLVNQAQALPLAGGEQLDMRQGRSGFLHLSITQGPRSERDGRLKPARPRR